MPGACPIAARHRRVSWRKEHLERSHHPRPPGHRDRDHRRGQRHRRRRLAPASASTDVPNTGARVARIALNQRGDQYAFGGIGPSRFDCSGLVLYAYRKAGVGNKIGGGHSARGMYLWGRSHGLTSRSNPRVGDVVIYGRGSHAGIYIGKGRVVHALNRRADIVVTSLHGLTTPFTTFIHTRIPHG